VSHKIGSESAPCNRPCRARNHDGYWIGNLLYCPAGWNVAYSMLTVRDPKQIALFWMPVGFPNAFTGKGVHVLATQILIADDDPTIRLLLRRLLEKHGDWQVCGEASNGVEAIEGVERFKPDVVVMDLAMPVMNGLQAGPEIAKAHPRLPMLLISVQEVSKQLAWEARNTGYRGAVTKSGGDEVLRGVEALLRHDMFFYADDGSSSSPAPG